MNINKLKISHHFSAEHMERYIYIQMTTGIGEPVLSLYDEQRDHNNHITNTGVFLITNPKDTILISAYYATTDKVFALCQANNQRMPQFLADIIADNKRRGYIKKQKEIDKKERKK